MTERCAICGSFFIFKDGEFICPNCNCTVGEDELLNDWLDGDNDE